jgi:predicted Zn-dependent peptidase
MRSTQRPLALLAFLVACAGSAPPPPAKPVATAPPPTATSPPPAPAEPAGPSFSVPVDYKKLANGLRVVVSEDHSAPVVAIGVYYHIGFRLEPKGRTGFAHLFEHMMFQGSTNLGKMEFVKLVQANGGTLNGSTRFDFTNYFELAPANVLETLLWAEADRMRGLAVTEENLTNQKGVVSNEVRVNVLNRPYGGFPWIDMPMLANQNWYNAHNFYGDLAEIEAATLDDVKAFFKSYYSPSNAVVVVVGDVEPAAAQALVEKYFGSIPGQPVPPAPDVSEPRQETERRTSKVDKLAQRPALAVGWHMPPRGTPEAFAMQIIEKILAGGSDSLLYQSLVQKKGLTGSVSSAINELGDAWNYQGPMTMDVWMFHDADKSADQLLAAIDAEVEKLRSAPVDADTLARAIVKLRSNLYDDVAAFAGFGKVDLLASFALFDDDPSKLNRIDAEIRKVTPELVQKVAKEYLRPGNRSVITVEVAK